MRITSSLESTTQAKELFGGLRSCRLRLQESRSSGDGFGGEDGGGAGVLRVRWARTRPCARALAASLLFVGALSRPPRWPAVWQPASSASVCCGLLPSRRHLTAITE